jgi:N-dimethylarginine dimethylaminohydrolase
MTYPTRVKEIEALEWCFDNEIIKCDDPTAKFDAANVCRLGKDLLYLVSDSGNIEGARWLQDTLGKDYTVHVLDDIYSGVHIDSTISPVREGLVVINKDRVKKVPEVFAKWDIIWMGKEDLVHQPFIEYPYASNYIGLNFLAVNPENVICDPKQTVLIDNLHKYNIKVTGVDLRHSRTLGGGHHCVTLDTWREND